MSLETDLYTLLKGVAANVYADYAPDDPPKPYVLWTQIGGNVIDTVENTTPNMRSAFIQVDVWGDTRAAVNTLMLQIENAMHTASVFTARPLSAMIARTDEDTGLRGALQTFRIWAAR